MLAASSETIVIATVLPLPLFLGSGARAGEAAEVLMLF
jgi:hypothetical protein